MTTDEIERMARDEYPLPPYTTLPDACYYETIRTVWERVRTGHLSKDEAHLQKKRLLRQYAEFKAGYDNACAVYRKQQEQIRKIGTLRTAIARAEDLRERLRLAVMAIAVMTGDTVFEQTELAKLDDDMDRETRRTP